MKRLLYPVTFFAFCICVSGQTVKTEASRKIVDIDVEIARLQFQISEVKENRDKLLVRYTSDYKDVRVLDAQLSELQTQLLALETEKKTLATKELAQKLPNSQIELLKVIALQNERIIALLEQLVKRSP